MTDIPESATGTRGFWKTWKNILPYFRPHRKRLIISAVLMLVSAVIDAVVPLLTQYAVNHFVQPGNTEGLFRFFLIYLILVVFQTATTVLYARLCMVMEMHSGQAMRRDCFLHLQKLPISFYSKTTVGHLLARTMSDTDQISGLFAWGTMSVLWNGFYLAGLVISMFFVDPKIAILLVCVLLPILPVTILFRPRLMQANRGRRRANAAITAFYNEHINGAVTTKVLASEEKDEQKFSRITRNMYSHALRVTRLNALYLPMVSFFGALAVAAALCSGGSRVLSGTMDFGVLSAFITYAICIPDPINSLSSMFNEFVQTRVNVERLTELLSQPLEEESSTVRAQYGDAFAPKTDIYPPLRGDVRLEHVWFRYPDAPADDYVLEDINLTVPAGTTVALVGETGAGKTTLVNLICRFFEPSRGTITIDGEDIRTRSLHWLHSHLGYVQQTPWLFSGTIADNIRYGKPDASEAELRYAAELVGADRIADRLPKGYDSEVGENGSQLSIGEKQLISFARAIAADPPLFVLDEATSSIDTETEAMIQDAIARILPGRTSFIIAHRLSTIRGADRILFIKDQGIAEEGTHEELIAKRGLYYRLYTSMALQESLS